MQKRAYLDLLGESGCVPLPLPPVAPAQLQVLYGFCDGIFLPGGRDVGPDLYGEPPLMPAGDEFQPELDRAELAITRWAARDRLPVLAVCRGVQMLNVAGRRDALAGLAHAEGTARARWWACRHNDRARRGH